MFFFLTALGKYQSNNENNEWFVETCVGLSIFWTSVAVSATETHVPKANDVLKANDLKRDHKLYGSLIKLPSIWNGTNIAQIMRHQFSLLTIIPLAYDAHSAEIWVLMIQIKNKIWWMALL